MPETLCLQAFTLEEICQKVYTCTYRLADPRQAYEWLEFCLIPQPKPFYTERDLKKFLFVGFYLYLERSFSAAKTQLQIDMQTHPNQYKDSIDVDQFISTTPIIQLARRKLHERRASGNGAKQQRREPKIKKVQNFEVIEIKAG